MKMLHKALHTQMGREGVEATGKLPTAKGPELDPKPNPRPCAWHTC